MNTTRLMKTLFGSLALIAVWGMSPRTALWAEDKDADEQKLEQERSEIDKLPASPDHEQARVAALAKKFGVPESDIARLRSQKYGWGEITITLALSQKLVSTSKNGMTMDQALAQIEQMRAQQMGWGQIAQKLGFKLGPIVSAVHRSEKSLRHAGERMERGKNGRGGRVGRPERTERSEDAREMGQSPRVERGRP